MGLLCFRNGSIVRDVFKRTEANNNWNFFSELLESTPRGNFGNMGMTWWLKENNIDEIKVNGYAKSTALHFLSKEIIPNVKGTLRWNKTNSSASRESAKGVTKFSSPQTEVRALVEGQMLHRKAVASDMGFTFGENTRILATGGASANKAILQVMSDVFNAPVYIQVR